MKRSPQLAPLALALAVLVLPAAPRGAVAAGTPGVAVALAPSSAAAPEYESYLLQVRYRGEALGELLPALIPVAPAPTAAAEAAPTAAPTAPPDTDVPPLYLAETLLAALGIQAELRADGALAGLVPGSEASFAFWPDGRYAAGRESGRLAPLLYRVDRGELYLSPAALARALPLRLTADTRSQTLKVDATAPLPTDIARARALAQARLAGRSAATPAQLAAFPYQPLGRLVGDVRLRTDRQTRDSNTRTAWDGLFASELGYATALLFFSGNDDDKLSDLRLRLGRESPWGDVFGVPGLTSAWAGDVVGPSLPLLGGTSARGASASAFPLDRPDSFDQTRLEGDAPPGWDVELYRASELLAFTQVGPDGRYLFEDVPLLFGDNELIIVLYGPGGQRRELRQRYRVGAGMAPPGVLYWRAYAGERDRRLLSSLLPERRDERAGERVYAAEADLGLSAWLTASAFSGRAPESQRVDSPVRDSHGLGLRLSSTWAYVELDHARQARNSLGREGRGWSLSALTGLGGVSLAARHERYDDFLSPRAARGLTPIETYDQLRLSTSVPVPGLPLSLSLTGERWQLANDSTERSTRAQLSFALAGVYLTQVLEQRDLDSGGSSPATRQRLWIPTAAVSVARDLRVSATARYDLERSELQQVLLSSNYRLDERTSLGVGLTRSRGVDGERDYGASVSLARDFGPFWGSVSASRMADGEWFVGAGINFAFSFDRNGKPVLSSRTLAQDGTADVLVFHDRDGDGRFNARSDVILPEARMRTDGYARRDAAATDATGWAHLTGLPTHRPVVLDVERDSIDDPFLAPAEGALRFVPRPGVAHQAQIPLVDTGTVAGELVAERGDERVALSAVVLDLVRLEVLRADAPQPAEPGLRLWAVAAPAGADAPDVAPASSATPRAAIDDAPASAARADQRVERVVKTVRSQQDGSFLFDLVTPGRYLVRVRPGQQIRGVPLDPIEIPAEVTLLSLDHDGLELKLAAPAPQPGPAAPAPRYSRSVPPAVPPAPDQAAQLRRTGDPT